MSHSIHAFLFRGPVDHAAARAFDDDLVFCELPQGLVALALPMELVERLEAAGPAPAAPLPRGFLHLDGASWRLAAAAARGARFAYVETDYVGGVGDQQAALWEQGALVTPEVVSINHVLAALGVVADGGADPFEGVGLDCLRDDDAFRAGFDAAAFRIHGRRLIGRYGGRAGWLDVRADGAQLGRWDGAVLHHWRWRPGDRFTEGATTYHLDFERSGTAGLRAEPGAIVWRYNDGERLVHGHPPPPTTHVGHYRLDDGATLELRVDKQHLYLGELRLLRCDDGTYATTTGVPVALAAGGLIVDGRRLPEAPPRP